MSQDDFIPSPTTGTHVRSALVEDAFKPATTIGLFKHPSLPSSSYGLLFKQLAFTAEEAQSEIWLRIVRISTLQKRRSDEPS